MDSAKQNLASSFVNGFVNTAFGKDKLLTEDGNKWMYKNKEHGKCEHDLFILGRYVSFRFTQPVCVKSK